MKKLRVIILFLCIIVFISGCSNNTANVKIDLGKSDIYTQEDLEEAANIVLNEIKTWESVTVVYTISYCGDEASAKQLDYCNSLSDKGYVQCALFESSFKSAGEDKSGGFNPNDVYEGWQWYLARTDGGQWELIMWGYA